MHAFSGVTMYGNRKVKGHLAKKHAFIFPKVNFCELCLTWSDSGKQGRLSKNEKYLQQ